MSIIKGWKSFLNENVNELDSDTQSDFKMNLEESIINEALKIAESQMDYQGEVIDNIPDALAIILSATSIGEKFDSSEIYDYFTNILK
jgi:hypothetical protein